MPPRKRTSPAAARPSVPVSLVNGTAVRLPDGGEALYLSSDGVYTLLKVGTGPNSLIRVPLEGLELVAEADETERHARFRADARRRGELES